jgi:hypothetical protein
MASSNIVCSLLAFAISIAAMVYLFKIRNDTALDAFQETFETGKKAKFFYSTNSTSSVQPFTIGVKCELYQDIIMNEKVTKLGDFFDLNIRSIHSKSTYLIIISVLSLCFLILSFLGLFLFNKTNSIVVICLTCIVVLANVALGILNFIIMIFLLLSFYNGDTYRFVEFLNCKNVNKDEFTPYLFAEKLKKDFTTFVILNAISLFMNYNTNSSMKQNNNQQQQNEQQGVEIEVTK